MNLLAYDTSGIQLSAAIFKNGKKIAELRSEAGVRHSNILMPMIEQLLKKSRLDASQIDVLAVGLGPGSFTGLRVGIATAKILGYVLKKGIVGISSLEAMATGPLAKGESRVASMLDARRGQVYGAVYEKKGGKTRTVSAPALLTREKFMTLAQDAKVVTGEEAPPSASDIAHAALPLAAAGRFMDPFKLEPLYLRARDCNVTVSKK